MTRQERVRCLIQEKAREIEGLKSDIAQICVEEIPDYHFLDWRVSLFWDDCEQSPVGHCVFPSYAAMEIERIEPSCRYCGEPVERK